MCFTDTGCSFWLLLSYVITSVRCFGLVVFCTLCNLCDNILNNFNVSQYFNGIWSRWQAWLSLPKSPSSIFRFESETVGNWVWHKLDGSNWESFVENQISLFAWPVAMLVIVFFLKLTCSNWAAASNNRLLDSKPYPSLTQYPEEPWRTLKWRISCHSHCCGCSVVVTDNHQH